MKQQKFELRFEDLKPVNIIQNRLANILEPLKLNISVSATSTAFAAMVISKKIFRTTPYIRLANVFVPIILMVILKTITNHPEKSKLVVKTVLNKVGRMVGNTP